ncbi:MAG: hypothetical protein R2932_58710 [Caldilineaceae bacterium]
MNSTALPMGTEQSGFSHHAPEIGADFESAASATSVNDLLAAMAAQQVDFSQKDLPSFGQGHGGRYSPGAGTLLERGSNYRLVGAVAATVQEATDPVVRKGRNEP